MSKKYNNLIFKFSEIIGMVIGVRKLYGLDFQVR